MGRGSGLPRGSEEKGMKQNLIDLLATLSYPVYLQGSLAGKPYPESFFTYWNGDTEDRSHYDNKAIDYVWTFSIFFYSTSATLVNTVTKSAIDLLKSNGWIVDGKGYDVPTDVITHTGRAFDALFIELESEDD